MYPAAKDEIYPPLQSQGAMRYGVPLRISCFRTGFSMLYKTVNTFVYVIIAGCNYTAHYVIVLSINVEYSVFIYSLDGETPLTLSQSPPRVLQLLS